eukprot:COSAG06_NODE_28171_length_579_cov_0.914583_2_plen_37_part_01
MRSSVTTDPREFQVQWQAPATGAYYLTVRSFIVDEMR